MAAKKAARKAAAKKVVAKKAARKRVGAKRGETKRSGCRGKVPARGKPAVEMAPPEAERSAMAALQRCEEARNMPAPAEPLQAPEGFRRRARSVVECGRLVQREISRDLPRILKMLLEETLGKKKSLAALKMLLQLAATYDGQGEPTHGGRVGRDVGFARRMMTEFGDRPTQARGANGTFGAGFPLLALVDGTGSGKGDGPPVRATDSRTDAEVH